MKKNKGFSLIEMLYVLIIGATLLLSATAYYYKIEKDNSRLNQLKTLKSYSQAVFNFVSNNQALFYNNKSSMPIVTISQEQLIKQNIISPNEFLEVFDKDSSSKIYPCAVVFYSNNKIQGFIYYRTDNSKMDLNNVDNKKINENTLSLLRSVNTLGTNGSVLTKDSSNSNLYSIKTDSNNWNLTKEQINKYFIQQGGDLFGDGLSKCKGKYIAVPSYVLTMNNKLNSIQSELASDNNIKQNINEILNTNVDNKADTINLDSSELSAKAYNNTNNNKMIFQSNENCVMNPSILSTMQDYDANCPGANCSYPSGKYINCNNLNESKCSNLNIPNKFGCRNKQLTLGIQSASVCNSGTNECTTNTKKSLNAVMINGFNQANTEYTTEQISGYLGGLNADTVQATAQVGYGDSCDISEIGSMAQQKSYTGENALEKIYNLNQSLLVCQKSLLCAASKNFNGDTNKLQACWLSLSTINVDIAFDVNSKVLAFEAPSGFYIKQGSVVYTQRTNQDINSMGNIGADRYGYRRVDSGTGKNARCDSVNCHGWPGCLWTTENHGWQEPFTGSNNVFALPEVLNLQSSSLNGLKVWLDNDKYNFSGVGKEGTNLYFTNSSSINNRQKVITQSNTQKNNWNLYNVPFKYKWQSTFPYQVSSKWDFTAEVYDSSPNWSGGGEHCNDWHSQRMFEFPYYITKLTLSNDTDNMMVDSANPPAPAPVPQPPSGTCTSANIPSYMNQEATDAMNNYKYDIDTGNQVVVAQANNLNIQTRNDTQYSCSVTATANYCPAVSTTGCKYDLTISMSGSNKLKVGSPCLGGSWKSMNAVTNGTHGSNEYCGSPRKHCSFTVDNTLLNQWVPLDCNDSGMGNYSTTIAEGTCAPANQCSNPITKVIYSNAYTF